jgi:drug/metabolite transporter (DMT)-like permease
MVDILTYVGLALWYAVWGAIALAFFGWIYLICCGPGIGLLWLVKRWMLESIFVVAVIHAIFFAPAVVIGHTPLIVPVFIGAIAHNLLGGEEPTWWLAASGGLVFVGSLLFQRLRSNYRLQRAPEAGRR